MNGPTKDFMPMPCPEWAELLAASRQDDISPADRAALEAHIRTCDACRTVLREYQKMDDSIRSAFTVTPLSGLPQQLLRHWKTQGQAPATPLTDIRGTSVLYIAGRTLEELLATRSREGKERAPGRYHQIRYLARGGFADVYLGEHIQLKREVAIKVLHTQLSGKAIDRFREEARTLARLDHPHIVRVWDFDVTGEVPFLIMDYIPNGSLRRWHPKGDRIPLSGVVTYVNHVASALQYAHGQKLVHRDVKPENMLVGQNGQIVLSDFGIATIAHSTSVLSDQTVAGTIPYMAPEQLEGHPVPASDQYSLGVVVYEWLCGERPFHGPPVVPPPSLCEQVPGIPPAVEQVVLKALSTDLGDRFASVQAFATALEQASRSGSLPGASPLKTPDQGRPLQPEGEAFSAMRPSQGRDAAPTYPSALPSEIATLPSQPTTSPSGQEPRISRRGLLKLGAAGTAAAAGLGLYFFFRSQEGSINPGSVGTITVNFVYSTEKEAWMKAAVDAFHQQSPSIADGKEIRVELLDERGSLDAVEKVLDGTVQPTAWSPASFLELNLLRTKWQRKYPGKDIISSSAGLEPRSLVFSPLVFAVWKERAQVLLQRYSSIDWTSIHDALTQPEPGWGNIGGNPSWGDVKFGHTRPDLSNSGLLTVTLMAYAYFKDQRGLTVEQVRDSSFLAYLNAFERAVNAFGKSSGTFLENVVIPEGPAQYDIVTTYENLILTLQSQPLQLFYPGLNIVSDHPFAILQGSWVGSEERAAALVFRDFLLDVRQQQLALTFGFRPTNPKVQITERITGNVFLTPPLGTTIQQQIQPLAQPPRGEVDDELITQWTRRYDSTPTANG
jgi:serine/threonine protein kinase